MPTFALRATATAVAVAVLVLVSGGLAEAHVQVIPDQTAAGAEITKLTFRVPNESATAGTTAVSISLPTTTPFAEVLAEAVPGWNVSVKDGKLPKPVDLDGTTLTEAPSTVTWTASAGHQIAVGEFQEFALSAGPIADDATELSFPTTQTYSDGTVVKWDEPQPAGADEPEHPLPSFKVTAASADDDSTAKAATTNSDSTKSDSDTTARAVAVGGVVVGLLGLLLAALAWRRAGARA